jgi:hypothetical protein
MNFLSEQLMEPVVQVFVDRRNVLDDMLMLYEDPQLPLSKVKVQFIGENGDDQGGLTRDLYTLLWRCISQEYFRGESSLVPHLPVYKHADKLDNFVVIGRIIAHMVALLKCIPPRLSRCTMLCLALGPNQIPDNLLMEEFRLYTIMHVVYCRLNAVVVIIFCCC